MVERYKKKLCLLYVAILTCALYFLYYFFYLFFLLGNIRKVHPNISYSLEPIYSQTGLKVDLFSQANNIPKNCHDREGKKITYLILHYTAGCYKGTISHFMTSDFNAHYVITQKEKHIKPGYIVRLAPEKFMTRHAGQSYWGAATDLNFESIGIEHVNKGIIMHNKSEHWVPFDEKQMEASGILVRDIAKYHNIKPQNILAHADIAFQRKSDPGPLFPWGMLYHKYGVGAWLTDEEQKQVSFEKVSLNSFLGLLKRYGYNVDTSQDVSTQKNKSAIWAFQAHFSKNLKPELCTGIPDENDLKWIVGLLKKYIDA